EELASELGVLGRACDVSSWDGFAGFRSEVEAELGPIDGVVNCAGLWAPAPYEEVDEHAFAEILDANLKTAFVSCRSLLPAMVARGSGAVVNFASTAGEHGSARAAAHYAAAKGGVIALTKSLAREVSPAGVRVNAVSPGPTDTPALLAATPEQRAIAGSRTLFGRLGQPHEIAGACVLLLSPLPTSVPGPVPQVTGGALLGGPRPPPCSAGRRSERRSSRSAPAVPTSSSSPPISASTRTSRRSRRHSRSGSSRSAWRRRT